MVDDLLCQTLTIYLGIYLLLSGSWMISSTTHWTIGFGVLYSELPSVPLCQWGKISVRNEQCGHVPSAGAETLDFFGDWNTCYSYISMYVSLIDGILRGIEICRWPRPCHAPQLVPLISLWPPFLVRDMCERLLDQALRASPRLQVPKSTHRS